MLDLHVVLADSVFGTYWRYCIVAHHTKRGHSRKEWCPLDAAYGVTELSGASRFQVRGLWCAIFNELGSYGRQLLMKVVLGDTAQRRPSMLRLVADKFGSARNDGDVSRGCDVRALLGIAERTTRYVRQAKKSHWSTVTS